MKHLLNSSINQIQISGIRQIADKIKQYPDVISLTIGEPDFLTPTLVKKAGITAIEQDYTFYAPNAGILPLREAAATFMYDKYRISYEPESEVIVTNGSTESIFIALKTILNPGDEVLLPTPTYPGYEPVITLCGGKLIPIDVTQTAFKLRPEDIEKHITSKTKAIILPFPSNPTGAILSKTELEGLVKVLKDKDIFIISDELYSELTFDEKHESIASFDSVKDKTIVINGTSKSHAMTGWRIGYTLAPSYLTSEMLKVHQYVNTSVNTMAQVAAVEALKSGNNDVAIMRKEYQKRRDFFCKGLKQMGFDVIIPDGGFYIFPDISNHHTDSYEFSLELLEKARVGLLPSTVFTHGGNKHLRISFASSLDKLEEALFRMEKYLGNR